MVLTEMFLLFSISELTKKKTRKRKKRCGMLPHLDCFQQSMGTDFISARYIISNNKNAWNGIPLKKFKNHMIRDWLTMPTAHLVGK